MNDIDKLTKVEKLFIEDFRLIFKLTLSFFSSISKTKIFLPVTVEKLQGMAEPESEQLELLIGRFSKLQDIIGSKAFREIIMLDKEKAKTTRDVINKMEQKYIIDSVESWDIIREVRNKVVHEYIPEGEEAVEIISDIFKVSSELIKVVCNVHKYAQEEVGIDMRQFDIEKLKLAFVQENNNTCKT